LGGFRSPRKLAGVIAHDIRAHVSCVDEYYAVDRRIDDRLVEEARKLARARGTSLNQLVRDYLEALVRPRKAESYGVELRRLTAEGKGRSQGWRFDRDELHEQR
jgi:hypothetical protein